MFPLYDERRERAARREVVRQANALPSSIVRIGVDFGRMHDFTAIAITEEIKTPGERLPVFQIHALERVPLGTPYPDIVDRVGVVMAGARQKSAERKAEGGRGYVVHLLVDATGVGAAVVDSLRAAGIGPLISVTLTGSDHVVEHARDRVSMGKAYLVGKLQVLLQEQRLRYPKTAESKILADELRDYRIAISDSGHASFNARSGKHDDIIIATGLSVGTGRSHAKPGKTFSAHTRTVKAPWGG